MDCHAGHQMSLATVLFPAGLGQSLLIAYLLNPEVEHPRQFDVYINLWSYLYIYHVGKKDQLSQLCDRQALAMTLDACKYFQKDLSSQIASLSSVEATGRQ